MNGFTLKWFGKLATSLVKYNAPLKNAKKLKATKDWRECKAVVDQYIYDWLTPLVDMAGVEFIFEGKENVPMDEPVIYTPNHAGLFDIPAMILGAPQVPIFMAKKEIASFPIIKDWMWVMDCVFVDRKDKTQARSSLHNAIEMVKNGRSLVIFPEGTRSKTGELGEFKGGAMKIAMETGAKIVPVYIEGTRACFEQTGNITSGTVRVKFLEPIVTNGLTKEEFFEMPAKLRAIIQAEKDANA
ncbi:MAG: 1-acyl-sn-glycerol-3-phosphate acyltransferase [Clostridia bacterium]|nr:1-acyl-sn-glycerol-3-phosphate acyltransferase [Clostridia bacterium]